MSLTFLVSLLGMVLLFTTLCKYELTAKHTRAQLRALRRLAERRAGLPMTTSARAPRSAAPSMHATAMSAHPRSNATGAHTSGPSIPRPGA